MKTLLLMRHAKSSWSDDRLTDHERPLNGRGERDAPRMGRFLAEQDLIPDLIITSTAVRAKQTGDAVRLAVDEACRLREFESLYQADVAAWSTVLRQVPDDVERLLAIGHNPGLEELVTSLCQRDEHMPTAAIAWFELAVDSWSDFSAAGPATLNEVWRPKKL